MAIPGFPRLDSNLPPIYHFPGKWYTILGLNSLIYVICCWFSHDITKIQSTKLSTEPIFYFHDVLEQLKTNFHTNFCFKRVLGFVIEYRYAWISKFLHDAVFTWWPRELSCRLKKWLISGNFASSTVHVLEKVLL